VLECTIYPTQFPSIDKLVDDPKGAILLTEKAFPATLTFTTENPIAGACKLAYFGQTDKPVFDNSTSLDVCIKEAFGVDPISAKRIVYDGPKQGELLTVEINCSRWASALMRLVYEFMERENGSLGTKPPFKVPEMRYVNVVLAVANNHKRETYLLEEVVDKSDGDFRKYINNTTANVLSQTDPERQYVGSFLSFAQHVQMLETKEHVFVSDQQGTSESPVLKDPTVLTTLLTGGLTLLSDPQIITSP
jgi:Alpha-kinase family